MHTANSYFCGSYENRASRCGIGACIMIPLAILITVQLCLLQNLEIKPAAENNATVIKILPAPPEPKLLTQPLGKYSPESIEQMAPLVPPEPKPKPMTQEKTAPAPKPVEKSQSQAKLPEKPSAPAQEVTAQSYAPEPVKTAGPPAQPQMSQGEYDKFLSAFLQKVRQELYYPKAAQRANLSGTMKVYIVFDANGNISSYKLASSNNHKLLGEAALKTIEVVKASWRPPLAPGHQQTIVMPVVFELK